ncbi:hypothetical protein [Klebsiella variicola]|uniref:hypothetical protein n=1 Tax=Klebsiella variicola TaxID=244366 RepID=UPI0007CD13CE|nr:hypothetical protein [Klebsiella variicola]SAT46667.1 Uncharacterised protein [Klebsiella variicola]
MKQLTDAQIFTLRRINNGTPHLLRGDEKKGTTCNIPRDINCPSLPALFRNGLIEWRSNAPKDPYTWYWVRLTHAGKIAVAEMKTKAERGQ